MGAAADQWLHTCDEAWRYGPLRGLAALYDLVGNHALQSGPARSGRGRADRCKGENRQLRDRPYPVHRGGSDDTLSVFHPVLQGCDGLVSRGGDMAEPLVVGVVISLSTPATKGLRWFRILPCSMSRMSWWSMSPGSSTPEGVN